MKKSFLAHRSQSGVDTALSRQRTPVQIRYGSLGCSFLKTTFIDFRVVRHMAERPVLETGDCGFDSRLHDFGRSDDRNKYIRESS